MTYRALLHALRSLNSGGGGGRAPAALDARLSPEVALAAGEFMRVFEVSKEEFVGLPAWKQRALRKKLHV